MRLESQSVCLTFGSLPKRFFFVKALLTSRILQNRLILMDLSKVRLAMLPGFLFRSPLECPEKTLTLDPDLGTDIAALYQSPSKPRGG